MICALRGPKLNIALGLQIFEFRACVKEISVGRFLTLSGRLFLEGMNFDKVAFLLLWMECC